MFRYENLLRKKRQKFRRRDRGKSPVIRIAVVIEVVRTKATIDIKRTRRNPSLIAQTLPYSPLIRLL